MSTRLRACCVDDGDVCGQEIIGGFFGECAVPVEPHADCESVMAMSFTVPSCCTPEGKCGLDATIIGLPCMSNEEWIDLATDEDGGASVPVNAPAPKACTP